MIRVYKPKYNNNKNKLNRRKYYSKDEKITLNKRGYQNDVINKNKNINNNYINKDLLRYKKYYNNNNQNYIQQNCKSNSNRKIFS